MSHYTIGEVLNQLEDEFDVTVSKIRFLESEGLIHPDRSDSGYRQFTDRDVDRLRYILRAQRDQYLPLKVIREHLARLDAGERIPQPEPPELPPSLRPDDPAGSDETGTSGAAGAPSTRRLRPEEMLTQPPADVELSLPELCEATGLEAEEVHALQDNGLIKSRDDFDEDDLEAAKAAAQLIKLGLEPRHLRMYRQFANREAGLYEQLVAPVLKQPGRDSRDAATSRVQDLVARGSRLHRWLLARQLRSWLGS